MKKLKNWWIFILLFLTTSFVNFFEALEPCAWRTCPDYLGTPVFTNYPNFFVKEIWGGVMLMRIPAHFSIWIFVMDILLAFVIFAIILGFISLFRKIFKK